MKISGRFISTHNLFEFEECLNDFQKEVLKLRLIMITLDAMVLLMKRIALWVNVFLLWSSIFLDYLFYFRVFLKVMI